MTVASALVWSVLCLVVIGLVMMVGSSLDALSHRECNPTGTLVESTGLVIRDHPASSC